MPLPSRANHKITCKFTGRNNLRKEFHLLLLLHPSDDAWLYAWGTEPVGLIASTPKQCGFLCMHRHDFYRKPFSIIRSWNSDLLLINLSLSLWYESFHSFSRNELRKRGKIRESEGSIGFSCWKLSENKKFTSLLIIKWFIKYSDGQGNKENFFKDQPWSYLISNYKPL